MVELASTIILGILAQWVAWRIRVPSILPLIITGLLVGPLSTLWTEDGTKLLEPIYHPELGKGLFPGESLFYFVSLAIGIILFEGGLTLKRTEIEGVGSVIVKLITIGSTVTFIGGGLAAHFLMALPWPLAFLFSGLIIVTGPTVIAPILQNIPLNRNIATVLKWEGILIDPIGALVAVLVFEFIRSADGGMEFTSHALIQFIQIMLIGLALGSIAAFILFRLIKSNLIPHYLLNVFTLAFVLCVFVFSDILAHESGLLSVVAMGTVLANMEVPRLDEILSFKESLSLLLISILFILLAANINMEDLSLILSDWRSFALLGIVSFVLRPIGVFFSTRKSGLKLNEKVFISWVGPRGIVAAGIASLFGITLTRMEVPGAEYITPLVFFVVLGTVLLNATTARLVARLLKVTQDSSSGVLILGASLASRVIARYLVENGRHVILMDNNASSVRRAKEEGIEAIRANIYTDDLEERYELLEMGYLIAMTSSPEVNNYAIRSLRKVYGENGAYRLLAPDELNKPVEELPENFLLSYTDDFLTLNEAARDYPQMNELPLNTTEQLAVMIDRLSRLRKSIPLFVKTQEGEIKILPAQIEKLDIPEEEAFVLIYLGKALTEEEAIVVEPQDELPPPVDTKTEST